MLFRATWVDYETVNGELTVRLGGRDEDGERRVINVEGKKPYIFVPTAESDYIPDDERVLTQTRGYESFDGKPLTKLEMPHPKYAKDPERSDDSLKADLPETYESDILYYRRCAIDGLIGHIEVPGYKNTVDISQVETDPEFDEPIEPRICVADIEVLPDYDVSFNEMKEEAAQPIICTTMWDSLEDEYTIIAQDPANRIDTGEVKEHLGEHWPEEYEEYVNSSMQLIRVDNDREMAEAILSYFENTRFDLVSGWNFTRFDWEYILRYLENQGVSIHRMGDVGQTKNPEWASGGEDYPSMIERSVGGLPSLDLMKGFCDKMTFHNWRSKALDYVSDEELDVGKVEGIDFFEAYENDFSKLIAYNIIDVQLCVELDRKNEIHDFFYNLADLCSIPVYDTFHEKRQVDGYILSRREDDEVLPAQEDDESMGNAGGLVLEQNKGIEDWVGVFDLKSLYPSCIITCNISPETMGGDDVVVPSMPPSADDAGGTITEDDIDWDNPMHTFSLEEEGIIPKYVKELFKERAYYKDLRDQHDLDSQQYALNEQRQRSVKVLMNSFYGVASSKYWRLSVPGLGDAVTGAGRYVLWYGAHHIRNVGYNVVYGDTDSVMLNLYDDDDEFDTEKALLRGSGIESELNTKMSRVSERMGIGDEHPYLVDSDLHGSDNHAFMWEFEKLYKRALFSGRKKRYAGHIVWKEGQEVDKIDIVGFESQRSDSTELAAEAQEEVMEMILKGASFEDVSEYVGEHISTIESNIDIRKHAIPSVINKDVREYPNGPMRRAVLYSNENLETDWQVGDNPWIVYVDETPPDKPPADEIAVDWTDSIPEGFTVSTSDMVRKNLEQPLSSIIEIAGYDWREIKSGKKAQSIEEGNGSTANPFKTRDSTEDDEGVSSLSQW